MSNDLQGSVFLRGEQLQCEMRDAGFVTLTEINKLTTLQFRPNERRAEGRRETDQTRRLSNSFGLNWEFSNTFNNCSVEP